MNLAKPTYIVYYITAILSLIVAACFEKFSLIYIYPLSVLALLVTYLTEKKGTANLYYIVSLILAVSGGILLILGLRHYLMEVSIIFSFFYIMLHRLMYDKNKKSFKKKTTKRTYFFVILISLPVIYIYDRVIFVVYPEIKQVIIYFTILVLLMLSYIIFALYYYLRDKVQYNLWMLISAMNLGFMNIIIVINELYLYDTMFTVIVVFCSQLMHFFSLMFMLDDRDHENLLV